MEPNQNFNIPPTSTTLPATPALVPNPPIRRSLRAQSRSSIAAATTTTTTSIPTTSTTNNVTGPLSQVHPNATVATCPICNCDFAGTRMSKKANLFVQHFLDYHPRITLDEQVFITSKIAKCGQCNRFFTRNNDGTPRGHNCSGINQVQHQLPTQQDLPLNTPSPQQMASSMAKVLQAYYLDKNSRPHELSSFLPKHVIDFVTVGAHQPTPHQTRSNA